MDESLPGRPTSGLPTYNDTSTAPAWLIALNAATEVQSYKRLSYDLLELQPGEHLLDVGCGVGEDALTLVGAVAPGGVIEAIDSNPQMIATAQQRLQERQEASDGQPLPVHFRVGRAERLPYDDGSLDVARFDRVLQHVAVPAMALAEVARVLRPGGRVVIVEPDWKMISVYPGSPIGGGDDQTLEATLRWQQAHTRHPLMGRELRALLLAQGFTSVDTYPHVYATTQFPFADLALELSQAAYAAAADGHFGITTSEVTAWVAAMQAAGQTGQFQAALTLFFVRGRTLT